MVRKKIDMKRIENTTTRQVTFSKRRPGLLKKAFELSVLCDAEVALIIFSSRGRLFEFSSSNSLRDTIERYKKLVNEMDLTSERVSPDDEDVKKIRQEAANMANEILALEASKRKLLGEELSSCCLEELEQLEKQLENTVNIIRSKKDEVFAEEIQRLKNKEYDLVEDNAKLNHNNYLSQIDMHLQSCSSRSAENEVNHCETSDVETDLSIGISDKRIKRYPIPIPFFPTSNC